MLKLLPSTTFVSGANAKCGEIYCHSSTEFTIFCTHCDQKAFDYGDFLLHFKNVHFENDLLKIEHIHSEVTPPFMRARIKDEIVIEKQEENGADPQLLDEPDRDDAEITDEEGGRAIDKQTGGIRLVKWDEIPDSDADGNGFDCDIGGVDEDYTPPKYELQQRKRRTTEAKQETPSFNCEICSRTYKNESNLRTHLERIHQQGGEVQMYKCDDCREEYKTIRSLEEHCLAEHGGMKCPYCDRRCTSRTNQQRHIELHTHGGERRFACNYKDCTKRFLTLRQCQSHRRLHTRSKDFVCDQCGYSCRVPEMLKVHYRKHTGEKPFPCNVCDKSFISKSAVREHMSSHSTERPHVCQVCGHSFSRAKSLYHHKFLHLGEKKFKCKVCGQAYAQLAGLAGHMRRHREDQPRALP